MNFPSAVLAGRWRIVTAVLLGGLSGWTSAQEWIQQHYTTRNGLPQNSVLSLAMDSVGFLWITTEGGLVRCDGDRFTRLPVSPSGRMGPERMRQLIPTLEKDLYVNDSRGQVYLVHGHITVIPVPIGSAQGLTITGGFTSLDLFAKALDRERPLAGRSRWPGLQLNVLPADAHHWYVQCEGALLAYADSSLVDSFPLPTPCSRLFLNEGRIFGFDPDGAFSVDAGTGGVARVPVKGADGHELRFNSTTSTVLWRVDDPHAYLYDPKELRVLTATADGNGLVTKRIGLELPQACSVTSVVVSDEHRMVAIGTDTKGLFVYHPRYMRSIVASTEGTIGNSFYAQAALPGNGALVATNDDHVVMFDGGGVPAATSPIPTFSYEGVFRDHEGGIWYSPKPGLERYDPMTGTKRMMVDTPATTTFSRFLQDGDSLWVADERGIQCWSHGRLRSVFEYTGREAFRHAQFIRRRDAGHLWFGTCDGLYSLSVPDGAIDTIDAFRGRCVRAMERIAGRWFIGTYGSGAFVQDEEVLRPLPLDRQGFLAHVHTFMPDSVGCVWMSTNQGLFRMRLSDVAAVLADTTFRPHLDYFGEWSGIENSEFNGGCDPAYVRLSDGMASFPTLGGLVWFDPEAVPDMRPTSPVMMEDVVIDGRVWPVYEYLALDPGTRSVEVRFSLPYWGDPMNVHLEYWLKGRPGGWAPLDYGKRSLRFRDLPPGEYELLVRREGSSDMVGTGQIWFTIRERLYQRAWARAGFVVLAVLAVWSILRLNAARLRRMNRRLEERVRERTHALEEANRELRASMDLKQRLVSIISHDIVMPLRFIERVARMGARTDTPKDAAELSDTLRDISFSAEKLYASARNTLSWIRNQEGGMELRPMHVALNPLVEEVCDVSRALAQHKGLRLVNEVSLDDVLRTDRDVLSIILHNLISNAIANTGQGEVRVSGGPADEGYSITVADTGQGISQPALTYIRSLQAGTPGGRSDDEDGIHGLGYVIIMELVRLLNASINVDSSPDAGTRVTIGIPAAG